MCEKGSSFASRGVAESGTRAQVVAKLRNRGGGKMGREVATKKMEGSVGGAPLQAEKSGETRPGGKVSQLGKMNSQLKEK